MPIVDRFAKVMTDGVQMIFEPRPEGPGPTYAGPISITYNWRDIPVAASFDLAKFIAGDDDPCHIVACIPAGWSYNGYYLTDSAVRSIAAQVNEMATTGALGHMPFGAAGKLAFPEIAAAWIGAIYDEATKTAYVRGIVDPAFPELKRHIRAGLVNRVSTDLLVKAAKPSSDGGLAITEVILRSIDFTPRLKNAFDGQGVVAQDMLEETNNTAEVIEKMDIAETEVSVPQEPTPTEPIAEEPIAAPPESQPENPEPVPQPEAPAAEPEAAPVPEAAEPTELETLIASLGETPAARLRYLIEYEANGRKSEAEALRGQVLQDMVKDPDARALIGRMVQLNPEAGREQYEVEIKDMLNLPEMKNLISGRHADRVIRPQGPQGAGLACPTTRRKLQ